MLFQAARAGESCAIFTSRSEGGEQYLEHIQQFPFFDPVLVGTKVQIYTLASHLGDRSKPASAAIAETLRHTRAKLVLLDGLQSAETQHIDVAAFLATLATQVRYLGAAVLVTLAGAARDPDLHPFLMSSDVIIGLDYQVRNHRHQRVLDVVKCRGRAQLPGLHTYQIDDEGVRVFPRLASYPLPPARPTNSARAPFGLPALDRLLDGGPNVGTSTVLAGAPGVGKTALGLLWAMAGAKQDEHALFVTFDEDPEQLVQKSAAMGLEVEQAQEQGRLTLRCLPAADLNPDAVGAAILTAMASGRIARLVIDDFALVLEELGAQAPSFLAALKRQLRGVGVTSLYLLEAPRRYDQEVVLPHLPVSVLSDNVLLVQQDVRAERRSTQVRVLRMRQSAFDATPQELVIGKRGIQVFSLEEKE
jgi:circadian clock protein KaiC